MGENGDTDTQDQKYPSKYEASIDLADRYEEMLQRQFDALSNIEDKAWKTIGAITSAIGIYLTGLSLLVRFGNDPIEFKIIDIIPLFFGLIFLFAAITYSILVLVSTKAIFGPSTNVGQMLINDEIDKEYSNFVLSNYRNSISSNWNHISDKSDNLHKSFICLIVGFLFASLTFILIILPISENETGMKVALIISVFVLGSILGNNIWKNAFQGDDEEEEEGEEEEDDRQGESTEA